MYKLRLESRSRLVVYSTKKLKLGRYIEIDLESKSLFQDLESG